MLLRFFLCSRGHDRVGLWLRDIRISLKVALEEQTLHSLSLPLSIKIKFVRMNISRVRAGDMLLPRDNLSLAIAGDEEVMLRLTTYLVPAAFGLILTLGVLGNFMVIGVVSFVNLLVHDNVFLLDKF